MILSWLALNLFGLLFHFWLFCAEKFIMLVTFEGKYYYSIFRQHKTFLINAISD